MFSARKRRPNYSTSAANAGKDLKAIYAFDGRDTYKICFDPSGKARPKELATTPGSGYILHVWKRAK